MVWTDRSLNREKVMLTTQDFTEAVARHLDSVKPDMLVCKQVKALEWCWSGAETSSAAPANKSSSHEGNLQISNDCLAIHLHSSYSACCTHMQDNHNPRHSLEERHEFSFRLMVSNFEFLKPRETEDTSKKQRLDSNIHKEKVERLKQNNYIQCLLQELDNDSSSPKQVLLCESHIQIHTSQVDFDLPSPKKNIIHQEDRYEVQSDVLSALHTGLFPFMDGLVDILELLLDLPFMPRKKFGSVMAYHDLCPTLYQLGDKVVLRLMEDLLVDECARVDENDEVSEDDEESVEKVLTLSIRDETSPDTKRLKT